MTAIQALRTSETLLAFAVFLQALELWLLRSAFGDQGIWRWNNLSQDWLSFPRGVQSLATLCLNQNGFKALIFILIAVPCFIALESTEGPSPVRAGLIWILLGATLAVAARFRGAFNGGSDTATVNFLLGCAAGETLALFAGFEAIAFRAGLGWIAVQITLSYWIAGLVKARSGRWWSGAALQEILRSPRYGVPRSIERLSISLSFTRIASLAVIGFEVLFPLVFLFPEAATRVLSIGLLFHLANFWIFGLNRFFFAWIAGYPALLWWVTLRR